MKKVLYFFAFAFLFLAVGSAHALGPFGSPEPTAQPGKYAFGVGYYYYDSSWDSDVANVIESVINQDLMDASVGISNPKIKQNAFYVQGSYSFVKDWEIYGRLGVADLKAKMSGGYTDLEDPEDSMSITIRGDDDYRFFGTAGVKGIFYKSSCFAIGPFIQASYYSTYSDRLNLGDDGYVSIKVKNPWDFSAGIAGQAKLGPATIYGGPFFYYAATKVKFTARGIDEDLNGAHATLKLEEKNNVGAYLGFKLPITKQISFDMEGQLRSNYLFGASLSYAF